MEQKQATITAKHLMATLQTRVCDSIKEHLEKAYEIGYKDACEEIRKVIKTSNKCSVCGDLILKEEQLI